MRFNKKGGNYGYSNKSFSDALKLGLGKSRLSPEPVSHCGGVNNPSNLGAAIQRKQMGGNLSSAYSNYNHRSAPSYGFDKSSAKLAPVLKGTYPAYSVNKPHSMCGGKKSRKKRKSKSRRKKSKSRKRKSKKRRKKSKSRKRKSKKRRKKSKSRRRKSKRRKKRQRGGSYKQYMSNVPNRVTYTTPNPGPLPWATGTGSFKRVETIY